MWHFDETDGIWKEEGNAVKKGNTYEGEVAHFSTWNFDDPAQSVVISVKVIYENSMPVPYTRVQISESNGYLSNTGFTDSTGYLSIWAIKGVPLKLLIVDPASNTLFSKNIGTVIGNLDLGEIVIGLENAHVKIKGEVINCEESFVNNGTVTLKVENLYYSTNIVSGQFELPLPIDPGSGIGAQLFLNDIDGAISDVKNINVVAGVNNIGVVKLCNDVPVIIPDSLDEYVVYTLGSDTTEYNPTVDSFFFDGSSSPKSWLYVAKNAMTGGESLQFDWNKTNYGIRFELMRDVPSTYMDNGMNLIQMKHNGMLFTSDDSTVYTVVQYGGLGEPIEFNYSGNLKDSIGNRIPIAGAFKITRR